LPVSARRWPPPSTRWAPGSLTEADDIRIISPARPVNDAYASGYGNSKWAGEVLLREANDVAGLPVSVFRAGMILAHTRYSGQVNAPDAFTRLLVSLVTTGVAPRSFYRPTDTGRWPRAHYDGLPVDFTAEAIQRSAMTTPTGFAPTTC
jgi:fatty acid CoA ligase FadD9